MMRLDGVDGWEGLLDCASVGREEEEESKGEREREREAECGREINVYIYIVMVRYQIRMSTMMKKNEKVSMHKINIYHPIIDIC